MREIRVVMLSQNRPSYTYICNDYPPAKFLDEGFLHITESDGTSQFIRSKEILRVEVKTISNLNTKS